MTNPPADMVCTDLMDTINRSNLRTSLRVIFSDVKRTARILAARPSLIVAGTRIHLHQKNAAKLRQMAKEGGHDIPVMMLISITSRCNLSCTGCYMRQRNPGPEPEMNYEELKSIISQAEELGVSVISFIGGEPLLRKDDAVNLAHAFPGLLFTLSTNGLLIDEKVADELAGCPNLVPFVSLEGHRVTTDNRRGSGTYNRLITVLSQLNHQVLFFGCAVTVSRENISEVLDESFIRTMIAVGVRAFIFIQYVPAETGTEDLVPTREQRELVIRSMKEFNRKYPAFFIGIPGEMELFGGCLAAGRGFVHVNPCGNLEPCPIVPVSDVNLKSVPLREALQSHLLRSIRRNYRSLHANGRCLLRTQPRWLENLLAQE